MYIKAVCCVESMVIQVGEHRCMHLQPTQNMSPSSVNFSLNSRVFSITGGASGMGAATARLLASHGAGMIWIADRNSSNFETIKQEISDINPLTQVFTNELDVANPKQVDDWVAAIVGKSGGVLHGAANVAGVSQPAFTLEKPAILAETDEDWARVIDVNLNGIMYCTRAQVRVMVGMPSGSNPTIVNVASLASLVRGPSAFAYGTSKAACAHFTACVAKDVYPFGIRANTVSPGKSSTWGSSQILSLSPRLLTVPPHCHPLHAAPHCLCMRRCS